MSKSLYQNAADLLFYLIFLDIRPKGSFKVLAQMIGNQIKFDEFSVFEDSCFKRIQKRIKNQGIEKLAALSHSRDRGLGTSNVILWVRDIDEIKENEI